MYVQSPAERGTRDSFIRRNPKNSGLSDHLKGHWSQLVFSEKEPARVLAQDLQKALVTLFLTSPCRVGGKL